MKEPIELTPEDVDRIRLVERGPNDENIRERGGFFSGAEYATKYERHILLPQMEYANNIIAGQAERIKELEASLEEYRLGFWGTY